MTPPEHSLVIDRVLVALFCALFFWLYLEAARTPPVGQGQSADAGAWP